LVPLRTRDISVTGDSAPAAPSDPVDTTWMPHPRRSNDLDVASTPYDLVRAVSE